MASDLDGQPRALPLPDPGVLQVVRSSAAELSRLEDSVVRQLRSDLGPLIADMAGGGQPFCERMVRGLLWIAVTDEPPNVVADTLCWIGATNWLEGFREDYYGSAAKAVVRVVRHVSAADQLTSIGSAWVSYFLWAQPYLVSGARQVAAQHAAAEQAAAEEVAARREAARQEAARAEALALYPAGSHREAAGDVNLETVADLLDDEDDEDADVGYGEIMVSMTRNRRRGHPQRGD